MKRSVIFISILLTAITLGVIGGVFKSANASRAAAANPAYAAPVTYQIITPAAQSTTDMQPITIAAAITADQAAQAALVAALPNSALASQPELVDFNDVMSYEVKLADDSILYVDAQTGALLYNSLTGTANPVITADNALKAASTYLNNNDVYAYGLSSYQNQPVYVVLFNNSVQVLIDMRGQVVYVQMPQTASNSPSTRSYGEHEEDND
jgi:hypothetical protein